MATQPPHDADAIRSAAGGAPLVHDRIPAGRVWWYPADQYELATLQRLIAEGFAANRSVDYALNAGVPAPRARFRRRVGDAGAIVRTTGAVSATVDGAPVEPGPDGTIRAAAGLLEVVIDTTGGDPAALTDDADPEAPWEAGVGNGGWQAAEPRTGRDRAPHLEDEPVIEAPLSRETDGLWAAPQPLLGHVVVECTRRPGIRSGESRDEALSDDEPETRHELVERAPGVWVSRHRLAVRWLRITDAEPARVSIEANVRPGERRGAFVSSDATLDRIWEISTRTLGLCMQRLMLDGVKRDRMPWIGDQSLVLSANAYSWADAEIARDSITALGRPRSGHVNGIVDYSLWWIITQHQHRRYFGASPRGVDLDSLDGFVQAIAGDAGDDGVLRPSPDPDMFEPVRPTGILIDWGFDAGPAEEPTALQLLWFWALRCAAELLEGDPRATRWAEAAALVRRTVLARGIDPETGLWRRRLDGGDPDPYAGFLAVLSGVDGPADPAALARLLREPLPGTPFMQAFALRALGALGEPEAAVDGIRRRWGAMLSHGAETTWEEFGGDGSPWEMYGRPFGKSLAHGWSAGPAALLPELVLGVRPEADGWRRFRVEPALGALAWASAVVPTPHGDIVVTATKDATTVDIPAGTALVTASGEVAGPAGLRIDRM